jgi:hypothetical protein
VFQDFAESAAAAATQEGGRKKRPSPLLSLIQNIISFKT